ncbi:GTPase HflX [Streptomyces sp. NPDC046859]|uniref:GTPase HflX n=1 Tax=Streptomyces sp. NPDC046859 TaxID=3155734 RepID=UPI0033D38CA2
MRKAIRRSQEPASSSRHRTPGRTATTFGGAENDMPGTWLTGGHPAGASRADTGGTRRWQAVLLALTDGDGSDTAGADSFAELERLAATDGIDVADRVMQARDRPDPATYLGSGKVGELAELVEARQADLVIADGELTAAQIRNLEDGIEAPVVDRTGLILDIFGEHARSSEGKAQVELAQLAYELPRLRGQGREMSRIGGGRVAGGAGIGVRGRGEMRLEIQRRHLRRRMRTLREQVRRTARRREVTRGRRMRDRVPSVAITGYTNAGKSVLLNRLAGADAEVADVLFATLDPLVRQVRSPDGLTYTLTDTVGFVRRLPHQLVDAFRSTLEEVARADLALHVVDASSAQATQHITAVRGVLKEIGAQDVPELLVLNKADLAEPEQMTTLRRLHPGAVVVSARTGEGLDNLRKALRHRLSAQFPPVPAHTATPAGGEGSM